MLRAIQAIVASPWFLELVRQVLRWVGVTLMTIGVPESIAGLTSHEDAVMAASGFVMYAVADTGWLVAKARQFRVWFRSWWGRK